MDYKTIDLCAGIGGIRKGFEMTGRFENVLSAEIDRHAAKTYEHLYGDDPLNDVTTDTFKELVERTDYDVLLAGFPCQAFSRAGKMEGFKDKTRGTIFYDIQDIIGRTRPIAFFLENVENLVSHDHGDTMETIIEVLEKELNYKVIGVMKDDEGEFVYTRDSFVRNTKWFGLPQNRPRAYIMGFDRSRFGSEVDRLPNSLPKDGNEIIYPDLESVLDDDVDIRFYIAEGYLETLKKHRKRQRERGYGFGYCVVNDPARRNKTANAILATGGSGKERNLVYQPKEGVAGIQLPNRKTKLNDEGIRMMTPVEWGRLQGFIGYGFLDENGNETFSFPEGTSIGQQYKQFGNSVSIPVIREMAKFMLECLDILEGDSFQQDLDRCQLIR